MKQNNHSPFKLSLNYGIYFAIISIVISLIIWAASLIEKLGLMGTMVIGLMNMLILVLFLIYATKVYRDDLLNGKITFGKAFIFGLLVVVFSSLITGLYNYIFHKFIDPEYAERIMTVMQEKTIEMLSNRGLGEDQIDAAMAGFEQRGIPTPFETIKQSLLSGLISGSIMSLISSWIVKKNINPDEFEAATD